MILYTCIVCILRPRTFTWCPANWSHLSCVWRRPPQWWWPIVFFVTMVRFSHVSIYLTHGHLGSSALEVCRSTPSRNQFECVRGVSSRAIMMPQGAWTCPVAFIFTIYCPLPSRHRMMFSVLCLTKATNLERGFLESYTTNAHLFFEIWLPNQLTIIQAHFLSLCMLIEEWQWHILTLAFPSLHHPEFRLKCQEAQVEAQVVNRVQRRRNNNPSPPASRLSRKSQNATTLMAYIVKDMAIIVWRQVSQELSRKYEMHIICNITKNIWKYRCRATL